MIPLEELLKKLFGIWDIVLNAEFSARKIMSSEAEIKRKLE
jgi:hypothetical protein